jgi:hypothetical protein
MIFQLVREFQIRVFCLWGLPRFTAVCRGLVREGFSFSAIERLSADQAGNYPGQGWTAIWKLQTSGKLQLPPMRNLKVSSFVRIGSIWSDLIRNASDMRGRLRL